MYIEYILSGNELMLDQHFYICTHKSYFILRTCCGCISQQGVNIQVFVWR